MDRNFILPLSGSSCITVSRKGMANFYKDFSEQVSKHTLTFEFVSRYITQGTITWQPDSGRKMVVMEEICKIMKEQMCLSFTSQTFFLNMHRKHAKKGLVNYY